MTAMTQIYVRLLNEGTDVWRPVAATALSDGTFVLAEITTMPAGETWEFRPGSRVVVEAKSFDGKTEMVAVRLLREHR